MNVKELVKKYGGQSVLAERLGIGQSAIAYWVKKNAIPSKWHAQLLTLASNLGVDIFAADLIAVDLSNNDNHQTVAKPTQQNEPQSTALAQGEPSGAEQFLFYASENGTLRIQVLVGDETVWASQKDMAKIFDIETNTVGYHLKNIFEINELDESTTTRKIRVVVDNGGNYEVMFYNLDAIISVGYRVNSYKATQFRRWATSLLKDYLVKGFAMDDERLKQGNQLFGKAYFDELLERIRKIRTSERMFWQKVTDLYSQCSSDYDKNSPVTQQFFTQIQNKFHYAIHRHTAAELIKERANASKPNMGLAHYANINKDGIILKSDIVGKNFLSVDELDELERVVENYLGTAELFAKRRIVMTMKDWVQKLDEFLRFNAYEVLEGFGQVTSDAAKQHAYAEYEKFRAEHDKTFKSDFDKLVSDITIKRKLPKAPT
ncbi:MAG: RhuM family protein [Cytophagales bacterium]|nr:RhuM family protein [Cytophagales bacterium]